MSRFLPKLSPLLIVAFFWAMIVAPWCVAKCVHEGGLAHWHELGGECAVAECGGHDSGPAHADDAQSCSSVDVPDALPQDRPGVPPAPCMGPAPEPIRVVEIVRESEYAPVSGRPQGPPAAPTRRTHGRGALPLLS